MPEQLESLEPQQQEQQDSEIQYACDAITAALERAFNMLTQRRDTVYAAAIAPLNKEQDELARENAGINDAKAKLATTLPARVRVIERKVDELLADEKTAEAAKLRTEADELAAAIPAMDRRLQEIEDRYYQIEDEKAAIKSKIDARWTNCDVQPVLTAAETAYCNLLNALNVEIWGSIHALTADERGEVWASLQRYYGGRR